MPPRHLGVSRRSGGRWSRRGCRWRADHVEIGVDQLLVSTSAWLSTAVRMPATSGLSRLAGRFWARGNRRIARPRTGPGAGPLPVQCSKAKPLESLPSLIGPPPPEAPRIPRGVPAHQRRHAFVGVGWTRLGAEDSMAADIAQIRNVPASPTPRRRSRTRPSGDLRVAAGRGSTMAAARRAAVGRQPPGHGATSATSAQRPGIGETARVTARANGRGARGSRAWADDAVRRIEADANRSADTHLHVFPLPAAWGIDLYMKDESVHPTGSLKHRLARSLFLYGLCNGWITERTTIVEASSGSTAVSEAYLARFLGLPFVAVMPASTSLEKIALIEAQGGSCHLVDDPRTMVAEARRLAAERDGHFLDQFTFAERATDWRGNNNIAESIFSQMALEDHPVPAWVVVGAGTGGTSATLGRYVRLMQHPTQLCVVDPEDSIFFASWTGDPSAFTGRRVAHRGHRTPARRAVVPPGRRRPDDPGARRGVDRRDATRERAHGTQRRRLHRDQRLGGVRARRGDARAWRARQPRHADLRRRRPLRRHVLQRRVGRRAGPRARAARRGARDVPRVRGVPRVAAGDGPRRP